MNAKQRKLKLSKRKYHNLKQNFKVGCRVRISEKIPYYEKCLNEFGGAMHGIVLHTGTDIDKRLLVANSLWEGHDGFSWLKIPDKFKHFARAENCWFVEKTYCSKI